MLAARQLRVPLARANGHAFSTTAIFQRQAILPTFEPSSSKEFDDLLDLARRRIMIPAHLNKEQQNLVYRRKHKERLESNVAGPVRMWVAGDKVTLEHIDRLKGLPKRQALVRKALELAQTPRDWENMGSLLEGLGQAGVQLTQPVVNKLVRKASENAMLQVVMRALQQASTTQVRLRDAEVVTRLMWEIRRVAAAAEWAEPELDRAVRWAVMTVEMMENQEHCGTPGKPVPELGDPRTLPFVIATPLELVATRALRYRAGADDDHMVETYTKRLCDNLQNAGFQLPAAIKPQGGNLAQARYATFNTARNKMLHLVSVWHGLKLAHRVLKPLNRMPLDDVQTYRLLNQAFDELDRAEKTMRQYQGKIKSVEKTYDFPLWMQVRSEADKK